VTGRQADAVVMVRAAILRSAIGATMAVLDPEDGRRGNRASLGQILQLLKDANVAASLTKRCGPDAPTIQSVGARYAALVRSDRFKRGRRLRNEKVAHVLIPDAPTPAVEYADVYALHDEAERLASDLHELCGRAPAHFIAQRRIVEERAKTFWDTYFAGLRSPG
jgi:hypothetical protein